MNIYICIYIFFLCVCVFANKFYANYGLNLYKIPQKNLIHLQNTFGLGAALVLVCVCVFLDVSDEFHLCPFDVNAVWNTRCLDYF